MRRMRSPPTPPLHPSSRMVVQNQSTSTVGRGLLLALLFVLVLSVGATLCSRIDPFRDMAQLREKWEYWEKEKDSFDTLFIGTSRTYRGVIPSLFDQITGEAGVTTKTFNYGIDGMIGPEDAYLADYVLKSPPKNLRWVLIEIAKFEDNFENRPFDNNRTAHWHDWTRTSLLIRSTLWPNGRRTDSKRWFRPDSDQPWPIETAWDHLRLFVARSLNLGRAVAGVEDLLFKRGGNPLLLGPKEDGFMPYPPDSDLKGPALEAYRQSLAHRQQVPSKVSPLKRYHQESVDRMIRLAQASGARVVLFLAPSVGPSRLKPAERPEVALIDFYDVNTYPQLFAPDVRVDAQHLNLKGAELFTRELASQFVAIASKAKPASR